MTTTTTRGLAPETVTPRDLRDALLAARSLAQDFTGAGAVALARLLTLWSLWSTRHVLPPPVQLPDHRHRLARRRALALAAEAQLVADVLEELGVRTAGTRAAGRYGRARDALLAGATWTDVADGGLFVTRGAGDHWVTPDEGCDCVGAGGSGWRCWGSALAEAVWIVRARAAEELAADRADYWHTTQTTGRMAA